MQKNSSYNYSFTNCLYFWSVLQTEIYLLTLLTFPYFQGFPPLKILYMYPFPLFLPLWDNYKGKFIIQLFNRCLPLYQEVLQKSALLPLQHGHRHSWWCSHPSAPTTPAHPWAEPHWIRGLSCRYASVCGNGNLQAPVLFFLLSGRLFLWLPEVPDSHPPISTKSVRQSGKRSGLLTLAIPSQIF